MDKITIGDWNLVSIKAKGVVESRNFGYKKVLLSLTFTICIFFLYAQDTIVKKPIVEMATGMRSNGKIYVVVAVLCMILTGLFIYLINLDKKVTKLEKELDLNNR